MKYRAYDEYKDSGEEWLGSVPSHWDVIQIKHLSSVKRGASPRPIDDAKYFDDEGEYAWTRISDVTASDVYLTQAPQRLSTLGSSLSVKLEPESLFLSIAGTVGKPCIAGMKACIHDGFVYFPDLKIPSKFLFYVFAGEQAYKGLGKFGTQLNLNTDTVGGIKIGCTSNSELEKIVNFLDYETAKIDTLIGKQQQLIKLLKEKRQAVISHAVTKGLNPNAPMRDSGGEWLGEVPEHWIICCIKHVVSPEKDSMVDGPFGSSVNTDKDYVDEGVPVIRTVNITNVGFSSENLKFMRQVKFNQLKRHAVHSGDVLFSKVGTIGNSCILPESIPEAILSTTGSCKITVDSNKYIAEFLVLCIQLMHEDLMLIANSNVQPFLNMAAIKNLKIPMPSLDEQSNILMVLNVKINEIDNVISKALISKSLLNERRTALISAAVTGKIDVRNWQAPNV
ncbi:MAG: restriction endonuclease subunit S [Methylobacter sp.]|jgi:type I restriction enzyme S subunit|nr:restriction endonuclease subunit S [Methylobacter sp.]